MKKVKEVEKSANYPIILGKDNGKLVLNSRLITQINTLHNYVGAKEWSGPVLFSIKNGDINTPKELEIEAHAMYPMNIGTAGYTEYEFEPEETFDMHDYYPQIMEEGWRMGHMHTHHNMRAYFSGTDDQELRDNTEHHAYYLSLIVNFKGDYVARLCVMAKKELVGNSGIKYQNILGDDSVSTYSVKQEQDIVYAIDLDVVYDKQEDSGFMGEVMKIADRAEVRKKAEPVKQKTNWSNSWSNARSLYQGRGYDMYGQTSLDLTPEDIMDVSDSAKEFVLLVLSAGSSSMGYIPSKMMEADLAWNAADDFQKDEFISNLDENFNHWYQQAFTDFTMERFEDNMEAVLEELYKYGGTHVLADKLSEQIEQYEMVI